MLEPIPFFGWFNWFEDPQPISNKEIADMVCTDKFWELSESGVIIAVHFDKFAKAIEEHHGIK